MVRRIFLLFFVVALAPACAGPGISAQSTPTPGIVTPPAGTSAPELAPDPAGLAAFQIDPTASEARFVIDEILNGSPNTVVGATREIQGEIRVDPEEPILSVVGPISIDAESFVTDNGFRNRAIHRFILEANNFPAITFVSTALEGLPSPASVEQTYTFRLTGDLTIRDTTRSVTFEVTLTVQSADRLSGSATATIERSEFGLSIPSVPQVAEVSNEVILELDFAAVRTG